MLNITYISSSDILKSTCINDKKSDTNHYGGVLVSKNHISSGDAAAIAATIIALANSDPVPSYSSALQNVQAELRVLEGRPTHDSVGNLSATSVTRSARYPRVAVILGVPRKWHLPLLLCRSLSTVSALWWACQALLSIASIIRHQNQAVDHHVSGPAGHEVARHAMFRRLAIAQIALSFLWVSTVLQCRWMTSLQTLLDLCGLRPLYWPCISTLSNC